MYALKVCIKIIWQLTCGASSTSSVVSCMTSCQGEREQKDEEDERYTSVSSSINIFCCVPRTASCSGPCVVWTPDPSGRVRKGFGNSLARKSLAGMPWYLNFVFRSSTRLVRYYSNFQKLPPSVELECWLADAAFFLSSTPMAAFQLSKNFSVKISPQTLPRGVRRVWVNSH